MYYLAIFYPVQFQDPQGGPSGQIMEGQCRLKKIHPRISGCSVLLFSKLGSQITNDFV